MEKALSPLPSTPSSSESRNVSSTSSPSSLAPSVTPLPPSVMRLWRPAAQRNLRNQWSNLSSLRRKWASSSSKARSRATCLVNAYLSQRYMNSMELGVLSDMPNIRKKASAKLFKQQMLSRGELLSSYKDMVSAVTHMISTSRSMRCFLKGRTSSPLVQFSSCSENENDNGDEELAKEFVQMFVSEVNLKRLLVLEFLSISCQEVPQTKEVFWSEEIYQGEFDDLGICNSYSRETSELPLPRLNGRKSDNLNFQSTCKPDQDVLQVYLTTWLADVNVDKDRVDEIFAVVGEEMHTTFS